MKKNHLIYYISLISVLTLGVVLIFQFSENSFLQMVTVIAIAFSYAILGILHHFLEHSLITKIVVEYVLIAVLGIVASFFVFRGGFGF